jgi:hypothetical protein
MVSAASSNTLWPLVVASLASRIRPPESNLNVVRVDVLEGNNTANRPGSEHGRGRTACHIDRLEHLRLGIKHTVRAVAAALKVLAHPINHDVDATEVLQAADIDRDPGVAGRLLNGDAGRLPAGMSRTTADRSVPFRRSNWRGDAPSFPNTRP